jgi:hypothetical protein
MEIRLGNYVYAKFDENGSHEGLLVTRKHGQGREDAIDKLGEANMVFSFKRGRERNVRVQLNLVGKICETDARSLARNIVTKYGSSFTPRMLGTLETLAPMTSIESIFLHFVFIKKFRVRDVLRQKG